MDLANARVVAVGDSVSEGVGDPYRGGLRGWVHHLTAHQGLELVANLARTGARVGDVRRHQLERVAAYGPDVVTCAIGVNDLLRPGFGEAEFARDYDHVVGALTAVARIGVLTMTLHDITAGVRVPGALRAGIHRRTAAANSVIERVSARHGAWVLDARTAPALRPAGMLSIDGLHPNRRGHRFIADSALDVLRQHGVVPAGPPAAPAPADPLGERLVADGRHLLWAARHLLSLPWAVLPGRTSSRTGETRP